MRLSIQGRIGVMFVLTNPRRVVLGKMRENKGNYLIQDAGEKLIDYLWGW